MPALRCAPNCPPLPVFVVCVDLERRDAFTESPQQQVLVENGVRRVEDVPSVQGVCLAHSVDHDERWP